MKNSGIFFLLLFLYSCQQNASQVQQTQSKANNGRPTEPEWARSAVLYECNIRQFSAAGNFAGVEAQLPRLRALGVDVLWLMPIHPIGVEKRKGSLGSPYSVRDYYAVNPDYGTVDDLKKLIVEAHKIGLKVILDWVPNHTSWDAVWLKEHPEYYTRINGQLTNPINGHGEPIADWADICDLDYSQPGTRHAMIDAMKYWIKTADIDGFRVDMAGLVPNDFWAEARPALDSVKQMFMLAEWQDEPGHFNSCFNANYGWKWKDITKDIASGKQNATSLDTLLNFLGDYYPENYYQLYFTQNHDENTWSGYEKELYGDAADAFNVLMFTWQGIPMLYNGQEDGLAQRLAFFEKDPVKWKDYGKTAFFQNLSVLKHSNKAVLAGKYGGELKKIPTDHDNDVYAFTREKDGDKVVIVVNLTNRSQSVTLNPDDQATGAYLSVFGASTVQVTKDMQLTLKPWEYLVLTNK